MRSTAQRGVFSTSDAVECGHSGRSLARLVATGSAVRTGRGAYADALLLQGASQEQRHAYAVRAVLTATRIPVAASHQSALVLWKLPVFGAPLDRVHLVQRSRRQGRSSPHVSLHRAYDAGAVTVVDGSPTVLAALACIGVASSCGVPAGVVAADAALRAGLTSVEELRRWVDRLRRWPNVTAARQAADLADARAESPGESRTRLLLRATGFGDAEPQVVIRDRHGILVARVDFLLRERVIVEFDGLVKYEGVDGREALSREKQREDALGDMGYRVVRLVWRDLDRPLAVVSRIGAALARSAGPVHRW